MTSQLKYIGTAFRAEWLKIKGLGLVYTSLAIGAIMPLIILCVMIFKKGAREYDGFKTSVFTNFVLENSYSVFANFFMLIFIMIVATRVAQSDHKNNGWTFMETQPLSKFSIYTGKFLSVLLLTTLCCFVFYAASMAVGGAVQLAFPQEALDFSLDFKTLSHSFLRLWLLSLGVASLQMMLSMVLSGFIWPFIIGFFGFTLNVVAKIRGEVYPFSPYNNVSEGASISFPERLNSFLNYTEYLSIFWAVVFFIIGYVIYSQKGIVNALLKTPKKIVFSLLGLAIIVGGYYLLAQPSYTKKLADSTIIQGSINATQEVDKVFIYEGELNKKIAEIPVKDNYFKWETKENIPFGLYRVEINKRSLQTYFSKGDNLIIDFEMNDKKYLFHQKGTRKAENSFQGDSRGFSKFYQIIVPEKLHIEDPKKFYELAQEEWNESKEMISEYKNNENIYLSKDFQSLKFQESAVKMLNTLHDYQKMTSFTDSKFSIPEKFENELKEVIKEPTAILYTAGAYKQWKLNQFLPKEGTSNPDSIIFAKISTMPSSLEKDQLLTEQLVKILRLTDNEEDRIALFKSKEMEFSNDDYKNYVATQLIKINNQQKGKDFPRFNVVGVDGNIVDLTKEFKGKYVVIDWWATWCGPCKQIKPAFEYEAKKHAGEEIVFVSLSVDKNKKDWELEVKSNKSNVRHFWLKDQGVQSALNVNSIPRFMIVDPEGKMYNADLARPGESNFSEELSEISGRGDRIDIRL